MSIAKCVSIENSLSVSSYNLFCGKIDTLYTNYYSVISMPNQMTKPVPEGSVVGGFIRNKDPDRAGPRVHVPEADELSGATNPDALQQLESAQEARKERRGWPKGKSRIGQKRKPKLAIMGIPKEALLAGDPRYARCAKLAQSYRNQRLREFAVSHGYVSAGASALLGTASLALAASRFLYETALEAPPDQIGAKLKTASQLADSARSNELAAWELCAREAVQRRKSALNEAGVPWLQMPDSKPGRPKKDIVQAKQAVEYLALPPAGTQLQPWVPLTTEVVDDTSKSKEVVEGVSAVSSGETQGSS